MPNDPMRPRIDCLIVGGGPAGLTAAIYLARFHLSTIVMDSGFSRAALIPLARNHAGFPEGISGIDLLARMGAQASSYGAALRHGQVTSLNKTEHGFMAVTGREEIGARTVLLATGVVNRRPAMIDAAMHDRALAAGLLRYCPICDGFEVTDKRVAVIGTGERGCGEALFLRGYTDDVTLVAPPTGHALDDGQQARLAEAGIGLAGPCTAMNLRENAIGLVIDGQICWFDTLYPALGSDIRSELAAEVRASRTEEGCLIVDRHQRTDVPGLYAAGDVVLGLDQISHAMGEGGVAAVRIRNDLNRVTPLRR